MIPFFDRLLMIFGICSHNWIRGRSFETYCGMKLLPEDSGYIDADGEVTIWECAKCGKKKKSKVSYG